MRSFYCRKVQEEFIEHLKGDTDMSEIVFIVLIVVIIFGNAALTGRR